MELQFDITRNFEKDLHRFSTADQKRVATTIDQYAATFDAERGDVTNHIFQPRKISLPDGLDSSLYVLRVPPRIRVILTIENDPLFDRKLVTLIRAVNRDELDHAFNSTAESLYKHLQTEH